MTNKEEVIDYDILSHKLADGLTRLVKKKLKELRFPRFFHLQL